MIFDIGFSHDPHCWGCENIYECSSALPHCNWKKVRKFTLDIIFNSCSFREIFQDGSQIDLFSAKRYLFSVKATLRSVAGIMHTLRGHYQGIFRA